MNTTYPIKTSRKCQECGRDLLLVEKRTEVLEGEYSPVTTSIYRCSDKTCQKEQDKKTAIRMHLKEEQEQARQKRLENMKVNRMKNMARKSDAKYRSQL